MFYDILDKNRLDILPLFKKFKDDFYLAGGTALALQIGHRDSIDFDFFSERDINTSELFEELRRVFERRGLVKIQEEQNSLTVLVDKSVKISFLVYRYKLIGKFISEENFNLASIEDIGCMKLSAITGRASSKDYIDLYFILKKFSLPDLLDKAGDKYPELDRNLILKSLVYFEDIIMEKIMFKNSNDLAFDEIKKELKSKVREYNQNYLITSSVV